MKQREIKFRAWDKESQSMLTGFFLTPIDIIVPTYWKNKKGEIEWMQYTGLKDKNGKEIYEGDIVKTKERIDDEKGGYYLDYEESIKEIKPLIYGKNILTWFPEDSEIIGNIYEHNHLLK